MIANQWIGCMDGNIQWRQLFSDNPLQIRFINVGQGNKRTVQVRETIILILYVEAVPQALRELMNKTEQTVIATLVRLWVDNIQTDLFIGKFFALNDKYFSLAKHLDHQMLGFQGPIVINQIIDRFCVDADELVISTKARLISKAAGFNSCYCNHINAIPITAKAAPSVPPLQNVSKVKKLTTVSHDHHGGGKFHPQR